MSSPIVHWRFGADVLAGAAAVGILAAFVALNLMRGVAAAESGARWRRLTSASAAYACGVWSAHFILMSHQPLPGAPGHSGVMLLAAFGAAFIGAFLAQAMLAGSLRSPRHHLAAAFTLGSGFCAAPVVALLALQQEPAAAWNAALVAGAWLLAGIGTGVALALVSSSDRLHGPGNPHRPALAAALMGITLVVTNTAVICAASLPSLPGPPLSANGSGQLAAESLTLLALLGGPAVLAVLLLASVLENRLGELVARARDELQSASCTDALTKLPNRLLFEERLQRAARRADRDAHRLALLFINLDGLKGINESFGQSAGDALLRLTGQRLSDLFGCDRLARAGGDEFLVLLEDNPDTAEASRRAAQVLDGLAQPCLTEQRDLCASASIGIAMYPDDGAHSRLIPHAAAALNASKRMGGATYCFFDGSMVESRRDEVELLHDLRRAIEQRELELFYQPKIHAPSGQITGAEALMRWHHPQRGIISPLVFIPIAERYGLIDALGGWAIDDACRQIRAWRNQGLRMRVAINLSVHQLRAPDLAVRIGAALQRHRLEPRVLTCEITESIAMNEGEGTRKVIEELAAVGVHLSIDDFGTGYSNLSCLRNLPAEELKIDRSFVLDLETSGDARAIVDAVVKLGHAIGLKIVAEGVETERQQEILRQLGCHELQGYLFARPMSARALAHWAMNHEGPRALDFRASLFGETRAVELA